MLSAVNCDDDQNLTDIYYKEVEIEKPSFDYDEKDDSKRAIRIRKYDNNYDFL